jgi:hypothetical protein
MLRFLDGPASEAEPDGCKGLMCHNAPDFLRVVRGHTAMDGQTWDALDSPTDTISAGEVPFAYFRVNHAGAYHLLCARGKRGASGWYHNADYRMVENQPSREIMANNDLWQKWVAEHTPPEPIL